MASRRSDKPLFSTMSFRALRWRATPAVLALLAATLLTVERTEILSFERLRTATTDIVAPLLDSVTAPFASAADNFEGLRSLREIKAENIRLREENAKLMQWYETALKLQAENKSLHDLLNVKADPELRFVTTRVVSDPGGAFVKSVLVPVGTGEGINKGNAVMAGHGLIGRVVEVGRQSARILLVTDLNSRIPVMIQNTRTRAVLAGKNKDLLKLERLPLDSSLQVGQRVTTVRDGGFLPPDIPVGTIVSVGPEGVFVRPLVDVKNITHVKIVDTQDSGFLATGEIQ